MEFAMGVLFGLLMGSVVAGVIVQGYYIDVIVDLEKYRRGL